MGANAVALPTPGRLKTISLGELLSKEIPEREPLLGTWLKQCHLSMVYAPTGVGKSLFSMSLGLAVAGGGKFLDWEASMPRKVLYVDGEMDIADLKERAADLVKTIDGIDLDAVTENFEVLSRQDQDSKTAFPDLAEVNHHQYYLQLAKEKEAELIIFDNLSTLATMEDEIKAESFNPIKDLLLGMRQDNLAVLLVHHSRKQGGRSSYRGTSNQAVIFNTIIQLGPSGSSLTADKTEFTLHWEKFRGRKDETVRPLEVCLETDEHGKSQWTYKTSEDALVLEIVRLVKTGEYTTQKQLAQDMGIPESKLSKRKTKAIAEGHISEDQWDRYMSPEEGDMEDF